MAGLLVLWRMTDWRMTKDRVVVVRISTETTKPNDNLQMQERQDGLAPSPNLKKEFWHAPVNGRGSDERGCCLSHGFVFFRTVSIQYCNSADYYPGFRFAAPLHPRYHAWIQLIDCFG